MTVKEIERIKEKIEDIKQKKARAEGSIESIEAEWKSNYGFTTADEAEKKLNELKDELETKQNRLDTLIRKLEKVTNWDNL